MNQGTSAPASLAGRFGCRCCRDLDVTWATVAATTNAPLLNLQDARGEAGPYQIRQFLRLVERYALSMEEDR